MAEIKSFSTGNVTVNDEDNSIFLLTGDVGLTLNDNSMSFIFMTSANTEVGVTLNATDKNESIFDLTTNSSPNVFLQGSGASGVNEIFGYGGDPNGTVDITAKDLTGITHNSAGTKLTTVSGGTVRIVGANYGVTYQFGSGPDSTLVLGNLDYHALITPV
jgi:hypothetical protein